ncbi:hypothetical protein TSUD_303220 [Trifolium subterraneum]|uniref:Uncharacterized protein n=1 Tax=Trifolium subterraneum TaxID=3900 RepID=A0A2Z6PP49_TRISU|nr:hypothetical protein TSUD_303220 [Trifolium subterraneum]
MQGTAQRRIRLSKTEHCSNGNCAQEHHNSKPSIAVEKKAAENHAADAESATRTNHAYKQRKASTSIDNRKISQDVANAGVSAVLNTRDGLKLQFNSVMVCPRMDLAIDKHPLKPVGALFCPFRKKQSESSNHLMSIITQLGCNVGTFHMPCRKPTTYHIHGGTPDERTY